jgi:hypothetical protein
VRRQTVRINHDAVRQLEEAAHFAGLVLIVSLPLLLEDFIERYLFAATDEVLVSPMRTFFFTGG